MKKRVPNGCPEATKLKIHEILKHSPDEYYVKNENGVHNWSTFDYVKYCD